MTLLAQLTGKSGIIALFVFGVTVVILKSNISYHNASDEEYSNNLNISNESLKESDIQLPPKPKPQYRLNLTVIPLSYAIRMRPILDDGFAGLERFTAQAEVTINVESITNGTSNMIIMHQRNLKIYLDRVTVSFMMD